MPQTKTGKTSPTELRQMRLAAELRSNLRRRKQQARSRAERASKTDAGGTDGPSAPGKAGERKGENA
jgi:hypothetical protein